MTEGTRGIARSVHTRLVQHAHARGLDPSRVLQRYGLERLLYRLARSEHAERFVLKGGLLLLAWLGETLRPTRDADFLGFGDLSTAELRGTIQRIFAAPVPDDGLKFDSATIAITDIRGQDQYGGRRVRAWATLGAARIRLQLDVGVGDAIVPPPTWLEYPTLLDFPAPRIRAYQPETVVAEKAHALVVLGALNSRMRDFFDLHALATSRTFERPALRRALEATFQRRGTALPAELPVALRPEFLADGDKVRQWRGFLARTEIEGSGTLGEVMELLKDFLSPVLTSRTPTDPPVPTTWPPGGPWT